MQQFKDNFAANQMECSKFQYESNKLSLNLAVQSQLAKDESKLL